MISNKMGRFMAVPDSNGTIWQQMVGNLDAATGYIYKWQNTTGHDIIVKDFYLKFKTHTGTTTNAVVAFVGTAVEPATVPTGTLVAATAVDSNTESIVGTKDIFVPVDNFIQVAMVTDTSTHADDGATAAAVSGVVGLKYSMIPTVEQIA
jgi:hypothetical protein